MTRLRNRIVHNVHIYFLDGFWYIPTVVKRPDGFWAEMLPVEKLARDNEQSLAEAIDKARQGSISVPIIERGWNGEEGKIWESAKFICHIYWYSDGVIKMAPQAKTLGIKDLETGEVRRGEWRANKEKVLVFPPGTPLETIAVSLLTSDLS